MPPYIDQSVEEIQNRIYVGNLPSDVNAKKITDVFGQFGIIVHLYLKRRASKDSPILLANPFVILVFERQESIDKIMAGRPYFMNNNELFVRRCLPITRRYPYEAYVTTNKMLVRIPRENHEEILPNDNIIVDYLKAAGGEILRLERFEDKTVFVEFDDYDSVDICCLSRPHFINNQLIEVEKCGNEQQARRRGQFQQKTRSVSLKFSPISTQSGTNISPTLALNNDEQTAQLQLIYHDITHRLEDEHERLVSSLKTEWEQLAKERIRLQRLTLDYQQEYKRLTEENRQWKKLYSQSLQEKPRIQNEGQCALLDATEKYSIIKKQYDQLIQDRYQ